MPTTRGQFAIAAFVVGLTLVGCDGLISAINLKSADEVRKSTTSHVAGSSIEVRTEIGSVDVKTDSAATEVSVIASVKTYAETEDVAKSLLTEINVDLDRRDDGVLKITAAASNSKPNVKWTCSLEIIIPDVNGAKISSGNGAISVTGLAGKMDIDTSLGAVSITDQAGDVTAHSANGSITVTKSKGKLKLTTELGAISVKETSGSVTADSGNGTITINIDGGDVDATTGIGAVTVQHAGAVKAKTGNGDIAVTMASGTVDARSGNGQIKLDQISGAVDADSGNGAITFSPQSGSDSPFELRTGVGSVTVRLPTSSTAQIKAATDVGSITINGSRQPHSVEGNGSSKQIRLSENGPSATIHSGVGSITVTLD